MKNLLLLVHDDAGQESRLQTALDLTRGLNGHLTCVDVVQMPMLITADAYNGAAAAMLLADERAREAGNATALKSRLAKEDVSWDWKDATGSFAQSLIDAADVADLIVVNRDLGIAASPEMRRVAAAVTSKARVPVVAVSDDLTGFPVYGRAMIAWDGSPSVMATMRACVPLLKLASAVHIVTVVDGSERTDADEAATYLSRHGIYPSIYRIKDGKRPVDQLIAEEAKIWKADYCLMGAYNHSRIAEAIFGGVTSRMLRNSALPLVLGH